MSYRPSYHPVFDNNCFGANSTLFIPAFKSCRKPTSSNNKATSHGLGGEGRSKREAHEKLRARKRNLTDDDDDVKYDKFHAVNLLSRPRPATFADCDIVVTAVARTQPPPLSPHVLPTPSHLLSLTLNDATPHEHMRDTHCHVIPLPTTTTFPSEHNTLHNGLNARGVAHIDTPTVEQHTSQTEKQRGWCTRTRAY
ncbi:hypothetical protein PILCRDRAFT_89038 [Piloderma croceum F 1598]|uniref:Uncharacterized protein n=1 Tax=Piloderma croceum (strain F 1598) TaxID=765440 RepID=A0A0C3FQU5_PILCF|nr:hypothetical protein PILCRDRAFT_89038 [Piloderma croceum F 1598]